MACSRRRSQRWTAADDAWREAADFLSYWRREACMSERDRFLISEIPGFTPQIGRLVSMMNYVRFTTLSAVAGLGVDELDYLHDSESNCIGALLSHIAAAEVGYQAATLYGCGLSEEERQEWGA